MYDPPKSLLQNPLATLYVLSQCLIDKRLVASATGLIYLLPEPVQQVGINTYGNPGLSGAWRNNRTSLRNTEIMFFSHTPHREM